VALLGAAVGDRLQPDDEREGVAFGGHQRRLAVPTQVNHVLVRALRPRLGKIEAQLQFVARSAFKFRSGSGSQRSDCVQNLTG